METNDLGALVRGLAAAHEQNAAAVVLRIDTPGGLDVSMREIIRAILASPVPVLAYVSPNGARAASAGTYILYASHIAAMAPATNLGAATPVALGGGFPKPAEKDPGSADKSADKPADKPGDKSAAEQAERKPRAAPPKDASESKAVNDAVAYIRSLAALRGRNADWAEDAVRKSVSITEREALKLNVVDLVADDLPALLKQVDGRRINLASGPSVLKTAGAGLREFPMGLRLEWLKTISDPNIAYLLMTIGTIGVIAELYSPGAILPGIVGAISLILAFYAFQSLPVNYAGMLLFLLGIVFFVLEASVTSYGLLAIGGVLSMLIGSVMLIKSDAEFFQISWAVILPVVTLASVLTLLVIGTGIRALRRRPVTGREEMVGLVGIARTALAPDGQLAVRGELWEAVSEQPVSAGDEVEVTAVDGLRLRVKPFVKKREVRA